MDAAIGAAFAFAAYLLFAGTLSVTETVTGLALAVLTGAALHVLDRLSHRRFRFSAAHLRPWGRAIAGIPSATARTALALCGIALRGGPAAGRADERPFRPGTRDDPADGARRATAVLAASLAPDSFVVRAEPGQGAVLLHGITRRPPATDPDWLA